jgi:hypothetical protein
MELIKFIIWLTTGAVIGWFASQMVKREPRQNYKAVPGEDHSSDKHAA